MVSEMWVFVLALVLVGCKLSLFGEWAGCVFVACGTRDVAVIELYWGQQHLSNYPFI